MNRAVRIQRYARRASSSQPEACCSRQARDILRSGGKSLASDVKNGNAATGAELAQKAADSKATNGKAVVLAAAGGVALLTGAILVILNRPAAAEVAVGTSGSALFLAGRF